MSDTPIADAIKKIPTNTLSIEGGVTKADGAEVHGTFEKELGKDASIGAEAGISQKQGWSVMGFFKKVWK